MDREQDAVHVAAAIIGSNNKVLACRRTGGGLEGWEFPGGKVEPGESALQACKREVLEELGCRLSTTWLLDTVDYDYSDFHLHMDCFVSMLVPGEVPQATEHAEIRWIGQEELAQLDWLPADNGLVRMLGEYWDAIFSAEHL